MATTNDVVRKPPADFCPAQDSKSQGKHQALVKFSIESYLKNILCALALFHSDTEKNDRINSSIVTQINSYKKGKLEVATCYELFFFLLLFFPPAFTNAQSNAFFRVYNVKGKKINKGHLFQLSDTSITLTRRNIFIESPVSEIGLIKSQRTTGHRILIITASVVGFAAFIAIKAYENRNGYNNQGVINTNDKSGKKNRARPTRKPRPLKQYKVDGNIQIWQEHRVYLTRLL